MREPSGEIGKAALGTNPGWQPFEVINPQSTRALLLVCDHASNTIPAGLQDLGLTTADLARHVAWDIGAAEVTRDLSRRLDATAVLSGFSRLLIDPNRAFDDPTLVPQISDDLVIPGNRDLDEAMKSERIARFHRPYHEAIANVLDAKSAHLGDIAIVSIHSFTPVMKGFERPWELGILWNFDPQLPHPLMARLRALGITVGDNEPYSGQDGHGYTQHRHADSRGFVNALIEIRQDLIDTHAGAQDWAARLAGVLEEVLPGVETATSLQSAEAAL